MGKKDTMLRMTYAPGDVELIEREEQTLEEQRRNLKKGREIQEKYFTDIEYIKKAVIE